MKTKTKRLNFTVSPEIDEIIRRIQKETRLSLTIIVEDAIKLLENQRNIKNENK